MVSPANRWIREYNAHLMSFEELADKIAGYKFKERKGEASQPTMGRALDYKNTDYEPGTFDDLQPIRQSHPTNSPICNRRRR